MKVVDLPLPATHALYEEAIARYTAMVKSRAIGIHRIGAVRYPGVSHIKLLVVTDRIGLDNRFFFSALERLPARFHALFLEEPFILPAWSLRVMRHAAHESRELVAGRDVLRPFSPIDDPSERWCRTLASYCASVAFAAETRSSQLLRGRLTMEAANAFRRVLADADAVLPQAANPAYDREIENVHCGFFEQGVDAAERVRAAWNLFAAAFDAFDARLCDHLGVATTAEAAAIARARLSGEDRCSDFDRDYAFRRAREIDGYHQELASMGFPFGHLFFVAAHPQAVRALPRPAVVDTVLRNVYRVRRRLTEYA